MANSVPVFSEQETAWHRTARFQFVPWVARLLGRGPLRGDSQRLPAGNPDGLTDETVEAVRDMMNRAVWKFLARDCGWRKHYAVSLSTQTGEETFHCRRLWDSDSNAALPPLRFTADAIDLLVTIYNRTRDDAGIENSEPPGCVEANGDLFLHHLIFRRLGTSRESLQEAPDFCREPWLGNPLNALFEVTGFQVPGSATLSWDRLSEPDVAPFFPWIGARMAGDWQARHEEIWSDNESAARWFGNLAELLHGLIDSMAGRPDLLIFLLGHFAAQADSAEGDLKRFEAIAETLSRKEREQVAVPWSAFLEIADELSSVHGDCVGLHPIERGGPENCFLAAWQEVTFFEAADRLKNLRQGVRPTIS